MDKALDEVVKCICDSYEYKECLKIKEKMKENPLILEKIDKIKSLQKKFVKTNDIKVEEELKELERELEEIPLYVMYMQNLEIVNSKISYVTDEINDYFYKLFNEENY